MVMKIEVTRLRVATGAKIAPITKAAAIIAEIAYCTGRMPRRAEFIGSLSYKP